MSPGGRVALVTGAARGIGAATVRRLVADGWHVTALDSCAGGALAAPEDLATLAAEHPGVEPVQADVRDAGALRDAVEATVARWGRLDAAVAAAAVVGGGRPLWETPVALLDELLDVDLKGVWHTAAAAVPAMLAGPDPGGCRFVAVASAAGHRGLHHLSAYGVAKHGVVGLVRGLAADLVGTGVTAVAVSPGSTRTAMLAQTAALYGLEDPEVLAEHQSLRRLLDPDEIAATIALCCSPAGAALHGSVVHADGGFA